MNFTPVDVDGIVNILKSSKKTTALEIADRLSIPPNIVISNLLMLENFGYVSQLNGYWSYDFGSDSFLPGKKIIMLIYVRGPLSISEITLLLKLNLSVIKQQVRSAVSRGLLVKDKHGKYCLKTHSFSYCAV